MLVGMALYWLIGMPAVAAVISPFCEEIHMSKNSSREFYLEGTCHQPESNDNHLGKVDLSQCIGMNPVFFNLEWKRFGGLSNYCADCVATKPDNDHSTVTCRCAGQSIGFDTNSPDAVTSSLNLDEGLVYNKEQFWCTYPRKLRSISQRRKAAVDTSISAVSRREAAADNSISANCADIHMSEDIATNFSIEANCHNPGTNNPGVTTEFPVKLDLNACITVDKDAKLAWGSGHAGDLCTSCTVAVDINKSYITCQCALNGDAQSGSGVTSTLELDSGLWVEDGLLWCDPAHRRDTESTTSQTDLVKDTKATEGCSGFQLAPGETLWANCGGNTARSVDLNKCLGFNPHTNQLEWASHGARIDDVCHSCDVSTDGKMFQCMCRGSNDEDYINVLNLDDGIIIKGGRLGCYTLIQ